VSLIGTKSLELLLIPFATIQPIPNIVVAMPIPGHAYLAIRIEILY
jgi:hypothetical protein